MILTRTKCAHCKRNLIQDRPSQIVHTECAADYVMAQGAKRERLQAKASRAETRMRKEAVKTRQQWLVEAQSVVNRYVRLRDKDKPCCSCDRPASWDGQWHASHFRSVGAASAVRFNLWNIHKGCSICNNHLSGNIEGYRPRLIERIGVEKVDWLLAQNQLIRYDIEYLKRLKEVFAKKVRRCKMCA